MKTDLIVDHLKIELRTLITRIERQNKYARTTNSTPPNESNLPISSPQVAFGQQKSRGEIQH